MAQAEKKQNYIFWTKVMVFWIHLGLHGVQHKVWSTSRACRKMALNVVFIIPKAPQ